MMQLTQVNGYAVLAMLTDQTSPTAQAVVVCDRGTAQRDRYVVWTVAMISGQLDARHGRYCDSYSRALAIATERVAE